MGSAGAQDCKRQPRSSSSAGRRRRCFEIASTLAKHTERVFPYSPEYVAEELRKECERLGLPKMTMHGLRHLHGSLLLAEGLPVPEVSQRLGHSSPAITMAIYAHALRQDRAAEVMERVLS